MSDILRMDVELGDGVEEIPVAHVSVVRSFPCLDQDDAIFARGAADAGRSASHSPATTISPVAALVG